MEIKSLQEARAPPSAPQKEVIQSTQGEELYCWEKAVAQEYQSQAAGFPEPEYAQVLKFFYRCFQAHQKTAVCLSTGQGLTLGSLPLIGAIWLPRGRGGSSSAHLIAAYCYTKIRLLVAYQLSYLLEKSYVQTLTCPSALGQNISNSSPSKMLISARRSEHCLAQASRQLKLDCWGDPLCRKLLGICQR